MEYNYFISYAYDKGFGCCDVTLEKSIENMNDIKSVVDIIKEHDEIDVTVIYWKRF